jgi:HEAT repeat protein
LLKETSHIGASEPPHRKSADLATQFVSSLNLRKIKEVEPILEGYFKHKLLSFEQLPEDMRRKIKLDQVIKKFLRDSSSFFNQFDKIQDKEKYLQMARSFTRIIPELIRRDQYEEVLNIITHIDRHFNENENLSVYAGQILEEIERGEILQALKGGFLTGKKEIREAIAPIFVRLHKRSVPHLLSLLKQSDDHSVRKHACEMLLQIDSSAINLILNGPNKIEIRSTIDILRVLGEIKCDEWIQPLENILRSYLSQENPRLREEALLAYYKIMGGENEQLYLEHLNDTDIGVQKRAIQCLCEIKSEVALENFLELLKKAEDFPSDKNQQVEVQLYSALGSYMDVEWPGISSPEDFLLETLDRRVALGPLKFIKKKKNLLNEDAVSAICDTLGKIGTNRSSAILQKLEKQHDSPWKKNVQEALKKISERENDIR